MMERRHKKREYPVWLLIGSSSLLVISLWGINLWSAFKHNDTSGLSGTFGDTFGITTSLFSGLAFAGIIISIYLQSKELRYQRIELRLQRKELKSQSEEFKEQNKVLEQQKFETTFFNLVESIIVQRTSLAEQFHAYKAHFGLIDADIYHGTYDLLKNRSEQLKSIAEQIEQHLQQFPFLIRYILESKMTNQAFYLSYLQLKTSEAEMKALFYHSLYLNKADFVPVIYSGFLNNISKIPNMEHRKEYKRRISMHMERIESIWPAASEQ